MTDKQLYILTDLRNSSYSRFGDLLNDDSIKYILKILADEYTLEKVYEMLKQFKTYPENF